MPRPKAGGPSEYQSRYFVLVGLIDRVRVLFQSNGNASRIRLDGRRMSCMPASLCAEKDGSSKKGC